MSSCWKLTVRGPPPPRTASPAPIKEAPWGGFELPTSGSAARDLNPGAIALAPHRLGYLLQQSPVVPGRLANWQQDDLPPLPPQLNPSGEEPQNAKSRVGVRGHAGQILMLIALGCFERWHRPPPGQVGTSSPAALHHFFSAFNHQLNPHVQAQSILVALARADSTAGVR